MDLILNTCKSFGIIILEYCEKSIWLEVTLSQPANEAGISKSTFLFVG